MRKVLVALVAIVILTVAGVLIAAPRGTAGGHQASTSMGLDIFAIIKRPRDLPEQSYPAH